MTDDESEGESRMAQSIRALARIGDYVVDIAAILALAFVSGSGASQATVQILAGAITSVAVGKRYLQSRKP